MTVKLYPLEHPISKRVEDFITLNIDNGIVINPKFEENLHRLCQETAVDERFKCVLKHSGLYASINRLLNL